MFRKLRTNLSRMFLPDLYTPEGFRLAKRQYAGPQDTINLPADQKRTVTVCNLFSNERKRIDEIVQLLDTDRRTVIHALIHEGLVLDRRQRQHSQQPDRRSK